MRRLGNVVAALGVLAQGCQRGTATTGGRDGAVPVTAAVDARETERPTARMPVVDRCSDRIARREGEDLLEFAFEDGPLGAARTAACLASLGDAEDPVRRRARRFAIARRVPTASLSALWDAVDVTERALVVRGLAGRARSDAPTAPPAAWGLDPTMDLGMATVISRFRLPVATGPGDGVLAIQGLGSADHERQVATARWLRMVPWNPHLDELAVVTPTATPVLVRSLAEGSASANVDWGGWLALVAGRARIAPRLWGNAWRALRDGVPKEQATPVRVATWVSALDALGPVRSLDGATRAWFECEDAAAVDRWLGRVDRTPRCAPGPDERWIAQAMTARVLGEQRGRDAERAEALTAIRQASNGRPMVVSEVATAACGLSRRAALPLLASLARERDPAVLAVLLEGLVAHPELARAMELSAREGLIRAPFEAPEGPTLEARVQAIHLAKILGREELVSVARDSEVRAVQRALADDGGLAATPDGAAGASALGAEEAGRGRASVRPDSARSERVRFETDAGRFEIALDGAAAPRAIADLRERVRAHRYDGLTFHRVVPGFVAQGGDPRGDGYGGTETPVRTELSMGAFGRGAVGVPLAGLDTGGMQLFVVTEDAPHLDGRYPRIGTVIRGMDVVDGLLPGDRMTRVTLVTEDAPDSGGP